MYSCRLCGSYPRNNEHTENLKKIANISKNVYLPVSNFSNGIITSGLKDRR